MLKDFKLRIEVRAPIEDFEERDMIAGLPQLPNRPNIKAPPYGSAPGGMITVEVKRFGPGETVNIRLKDPTLGWRKIAEVVVDAEGYGSVEVTIPGDSALGSAKIRAFGQTTRIKRTKDFEIGFI